MVKPSYAQEQAVYDETGMTSSFVQTYSGKSASEVTDLINSYLLTAESKVKQMIFKDNKGATIHGELHLGTGEDDEFDLGPEDEVYFTDYDPKNCVENLFACYFNKERRKMPYPKDCDKFTERKSLYTTSNIIITDDESTALTADASEDAEYVKVNSVSHLTIGDRVLLKGDNYEEWKEVEDIDTTNKYVYFTVELRYDYQYNTTGSNPNAKLYGPIYAGEKTLKCVASAAGYIEYKSFVKNIDIYDYTTFRIKCNDATVTFTLYLYDDGGNATTQTFTVTKADVPEIISLMIDEFSGSIDWNDIKCYGFRLAVNKACTFYFDNFSFNDEWSWSPIVGKFIVSHTKDEEPPADRYPFYVTYKFDPFKQEIPECIKAATAQLAGVRLIDFLIGVRERDIAFEVEAETGVPVPDKETLYHTRGTLIARANANIAEYGYGFEFVITGEAGVESTKEWLV